MRIQSRAAKVAALSAGERRSIVQLIEGTQLTRQAVTKHLRVLEGARIVRSVRSGRESMFEFDPEPIRRVSEYAELISAHWDAALGRLKALVEQE